MEAHREKNKTKTKTKKMDRTGALYEGLDGGAGFSHLSVNF